MVRVFIGFRMKFVFIVHHLRGIVLNITNVLINNLYLKY